jgi:hypothetical protein
LMRGIIVRTVGNFSTECIEARSTRVPIARSTADLLPSGSGERIH